MNEKKKVSVETIIRTVVLAVTLINSVLTMLGKNPLPFAEDELYSMLSAAAAIAATLWAWWKNNSFTTEAITADEYLHELKTDAEAAKLNNDETQQRRNGGFIMAFLTPDSTYTAKVGNDSITVKVKITPDGARATKDICSYVKKGDLVKPNAKLNNGTGKPKGITVHNTDNIAVASGTTPAEQYARATYPNGNMKGVAVHYWVYKSDIWQQLADNERGWHAADGSSRRTSQRAGETIGGNLDTISIECIETGTDTESENTTAKLVAYLLNKYGLCPETDVYTHNYFYNKKYCPAYILPHWSSFMTKVKEYYNAMQTTAEEQPKTDGTTASTLYRVQTGAFSKKANADALSEKLKKAGFDTYIVKSGNYYKVQVGAYSKKANAEEMAAKLKKAGYDTYITTKSGTAVTQTAAEPQKKTVDELAREVIAGKWGNGATRKEKLTAAGYDYSAVQKRVNELLK